MKNGRWRYLGTSSDGLRCDYVDDSGNFHSLRTAKGKKVTYEIELKTGKRFCTPLYDDHFLHGKSLTSEEKAYRRGWLAAYSEQERIKRGKGRS